MREQISREVKEEMLQQSNILKQQLEDIQEELQQRQPKKRCLTDPIRNNQFGRGKKKVEINVISPTQQAVNQAKALIAYKRKLNQRKTKKKQNGRTTRYTLGLGKQKSNRGRAIRGL